MGWESSARSFMSSPVERENGYLTMDVLLILPDCTLRLTNHVEFALGCDIVAYEGLQYHLKLSGNFFEWLFDGAGSVVGVEFRLESSAQFWSSRPNIINHAHAHFDFSDDFPRFWFQSKCLAETKGLQDWEDYYYVSDEQNLLIALNLHMLSEAEVESIRGGKTTAE